MATAHETNGRLCATETLSAPGRGEKLFHWPCFRERDRVSVCASAARMCADGFACISSNFNRCLS